MAVTDPIERLNGLLGHLQATIRGQGHLIPRLCSVLIRGELGLQSPKRPKGSFLFIGPTGTGKTEVAVTFTEYVFGPGHFHRFDMSEFQTQQAVHLLLGQHTGERGLLGSILDQHAGSGGTLLFDEMEKAHPQVLDLFLQILDAGRITPADGRTRSLRTFYIVFTSNIGAKEAMRLVHAPFSSVENTILSQVNQQLRPELVARINERLVFKRLGPEVLREICELMVAAEVKRLGELGYLLEVSQEAVEFLVRKGFHRDLGARPMRDAVEKYLQEAVATQLLKGRLASGRVGVCKVREILVLDV